MLSDCLKPKILGYSESLERIRNILGKFERKIREMGNPKNHSDSKWWQVFLPLVSFYLALRAQEKALEYLNDKHLNYGLAWDENIGFPSLPSLAADAGSYVKYLKPEGELKIILESFSGWASFSRQKTRCACGGNSFSLRDVFLEIMINHVLAVQGESVLVKQLLGVKSDDASHLEHHYNNFKKKSERIDGLFMIWAVENEISAKEEAVEVRCMKANCADEFNFIGFGNKISKLTKGGEI